MIAFIVFCLIWIRMTMSNIAGVEHEKEEMIKQKVELEAIVEDLQNDKVDLKNNVLKLQEEVQSLEKDKQELLDAKAEQEKAKREEALKIQAQAKKEKERVATSNEVATNDRAATSDKVASPTRGKGSRTEMFTATAYDLSFASCGKEPSHPQYGITASGVSLKGKSLEDKYIAVDRNKIKLGSQVYIEFFDNYSHLTGYYTAVDTGGAIKGNKVDIFFGSGDVNQAARNFGRRQVRVTY